MQLHELNKLEIVRTNHQNEVARPWVGLLVSIGYDYLSIQHIYGGELALGAGFGAWADLPTPAPAAPAPCRSSALAVTGFRFLLWSAVESPPQPTVRKPSRAENTRHFHFTVYTSMISQGIQRSRSIKIEHITIGLTRARLKGLPR